MGINIEEPKNTQTMHFWGDGEDPDCFTKLVVWITHPDCEAAKDFRANVNLTNVLSKIQKGVSYETACEVCGKRAKVLIGWQREETDG